MNKRNELAKKAHANAVAKGFYKEKMSNEHYLMLIISEVAELVEADRKGLCANVKSFERMYSNEQSFPFKSMYNRDTTASAFAQNIKNTKEDEFADIAIRLYDLAGYLGVEFNNILVDINDDAFSCLEFTEKAYTLCNILSSRTQEYEHTICVALYMIEFWAKHENIALDYFITHKMRYNEGREVLHGNKY